ncbi:MAG: class I SAM-dependent methyltransferase [Fibrobacteres bacterium]|nr:class I SAM-dependent methyltransferase [Fibrobacterota bacterium]
MKEQIIKLLPSSVVQTLQKFSLANKLRHDYKRLPFSIDDLPVSTMKSSYAITKDKLSMPYLKTMEKLRSYYAAGPIGPNKFWEYPWILSNLELKPHLSILDAGCGRAPLQYFLAEMSMKMSGIDPNENVGWHGIDRRLARKYGVDIDYRVEGMEKISYPDESFDRVMSVSVIEHVRACHVKDELLTPQCEADRLLQGKMMQEMARVLKKGGLLIITIDVMYPAEGIILEANINVKNLIESSGLQLVGPEPEAGFYGYDNFDMQAILRDNEIDVQDYTGVKGTSLGLILRKP